MASGSDDRKKDAVYRTILDYFLAGRYRFGDSILVKALSGEIGVSRQPVMAALNRLAVEGFVTITAQVGCQLVAPSAVEIADFYLLFSRYEGLMAELAAGRRTAREVRAMRLANTAISMIAADGDDAGRDYRELNRAFHTAIHEASHSPKLMERSQSAWTMSDFLITQTYGFTPHLKDAVTEHNLIISAIEARDAARARSAAEQHILSVATLVASGMKTGVAA
jgi:DNA-binding GntR family transcriptional regulator